MLFFIVNVSFSVIVWFMFIDEKCEFGYFGVDASYVVMYDFNLVIAILVYACLCFVRCECLH